MEIFFAHKIFTLIVIQFLGDYYKHHFDIKLQYKFNELATSEF